VSEGYLTSCGHLVCTDPGLKNIEAESKAQGRSVFDCPGCGNEPTSLDVFSPSMRRRIKPIIHRKMPPPEVLDVNTPKKRLSQTLNRGEAKRQHISKPLAHAKYNATIASAATDVSFRSQDSDTKPPNVTNADLHAQISLLHAAYTLFEKRTRDMQDDIKKLTITVMANANNVVIITHQLNRIK
jgi:hypothetical protein